MSSISRLRSRQIALGAAGQLAAARLGGLEHLL
jgi:hypothetical protein